MPDCAYCGKDLVNGDRLEPEKTETLKAVILDRFFVEQPDDLVVCRECYRVIAWLYNPT